MGTLIENAIEQSWQEFQEVTPSFFMGSPSTCRKAHKWGMGRRYRMDSYRVVNE